MSRYIDADALKKTIDEEIFRHDTTDHVFQIIDDAPSIDIVRCRECKYAEVSVSPITELWCIRFGINDMDVEDDDFCSYGEREGE